MRPSLKVRNSDQDSWEPKVRSLDFYKKTRFKQKEIQITANRYCEGKFFVFGDIMNCFGISILLLDAYLCSDSSRCY